MESAVARILDDLEQRGGLKGSDVANIVNVSRPTVSRWKSGKASPPLATQTIIADLSYVVERLSDFYTPAETRLPGTTMQPATSSAKPTSSAMRGPIHTMRLAG